ncbi:helix-turn-helix transcriptional regulator [Streptomyces sp. RK75]|nr:helix-turn-helix transcriptional regulator [Streptomyces sp. RK75]
MPVPSPRPAADGDAVAELYVPEARQWLSTSTGRVAPEGYSWLQGVHWVAGSGLYEPRRHRSHGPRSFGPTTVFVAQLLAELSPCRPGIEYLVRRTGLSERTVEYHLQMLRETGLLAYIVKGTRVRGEKPQTSEFALMIPPQFDHALGIVTAGQGTGRRMTGIAETGRALMTKLAKKAARKVRRPQPKSPSKTAPTLARGTDQPMDSGSSRCTPMGGSPQGSSAAGATSSPPESKLASGESQSPTPKKSKRKTGGRRKLNKIGRRYRLAGELIREIDWLSRCHVDRIAWVARHVADAGWTVTEVCAWLHLRGETGRVRRGSGLLATLLAGAETVLDTPAKRTAAVDQWRAAQETARRHRIRQVRARTEQFDGDWQAPDNQDVRREVEAAFAQVSEMAHGGRHQVQDHADDRQTAEPELSEQELADLRATAAGQLMQGETDLITMAVDGMGREEAVRIYGEHLVRRALQLARGSRSSLMAIGAR